MSVSPIQPARRASRRSAAVLNCLTLLVLLLTCLGAMRVLGPDAVPRDPWMADLLGTFDHIR